MFGEGGFGHSPLANSAQQEEQRGTLESSPVRAAPDPLGTQLHPSPRNCSKGFGLGGVEAGRSSPTRPLSLDSASSPQASQPGSSSRLPCHQRGLGSAPCPRGVGGLVQPSRASA